VLPEFVLIVPALMLPLLLIVPVFAMPLLPPVILIPDAGAIEVSLIKIAVDAIC